MENNNGNSDPQNGGNGNGNPPNANYASMDENALRNLLKERDVSLSDLTGKNNQLFERAKKAEGFEKDSDGSWIKREKAKPKAEKPDDKLLERLDKMTLKASGVVEQDEVDLALKWRERTGYELEDIIADDIFQSQLKGLKDKKAIELATSKTGRGGGTSDAKNTPEYWIAKGEPPTPADVADRKTRAKIIRGMMDAGKDGKKFYNE